MESGGDWSFAGGRRANPELFSRYDVLERIGEGTFGQVFKGRRKADGLIVAMKETRDPQCSSREVAALMALAHPNVVSLIESFVQGPNLVLVLEYLPTDLAQVIQESERPLRESEIKGWLLQILSGVAACHRASILHRDLKPSNMLVGRDGSLKIADFGQARTVYEDGTNWLSDRCTVGAFEWTAGHEGALFNAEKVNSSSSMNRDAGSECKNTWIRGTDSLNSTVDVAGRGKHSKGTGKTLKDYLVQDCVPLEEEGLVKDCLETMEQDCCGCFCSGSVDDKTQVHGPDDQVQVQVGGCRSLSCKAGKAGYLIHVARSNHFAGVDRIDDKFEESSRRDWVLTEENFAEIGVGGPSREKDKDFFCKVRSFLKRRGRILHKQGKRLSPPPRTGQGDASMVVATSMGEEGVTHVHEEDISGTAVREIAQKDASVPLNGADLINHEEIAIEKQDEWHMNDSGIRPLMGDEMHAVDPGLIKLMPKEDTCCDVGKDVFEPNNDMGSGDEEDGCGFCKPYSGSGSVCCSCVTHGNVARQLDTGSESKRRKAYGHEHAIATEEVALAFRRDEPLGECNAGVGDEKHPVECMEIDAQVTELEAIRNRILYGKHGRSGVQKTVAHVPPNPHYAGPQNHLEFPTANSQFDPELDASGNKSMTLGVEKGQGTASVLAGSVDKNITRFTKEFESEEDVSVLAEGKRQWEGTVQFWDGSQQWGGSANEVSEGDYRGNENWNNADWSSDAAREDDDGLNGCFYEYGSNLESLREAAGYSQIDGTEDWNNAVETRWYRPPDVYDSYVKHGGQNDNVDEETPTEIGSQGLVGDPGNGMLPRLNHSDICYDSGFHETGVCSQQKGIDSTCFSETGDHSSGLSPFVGTLWYKALELLYGARKYGKGLDMWAVGCVFAELLGGKPLFPGITDIDQLSRVVRVLGAPNEKVWPGISELPDFDKISFHDVRAPLPFRKLLPHASPSSLRFLKKFLVYDPAQRLSAEAALRDSYFQEDPLPSTLKELTVLTSRRDSSASEGWAEWRDPGSPFSDFELLDSAP